MKKKLHIIFTVIYIIGFIMFSAGFSRLNVNLVITGFIILAVGILGAAFASDLTGKIQNPRMPF